MVFFEIYGEQKTLTQWDLGRRMQVNLPCQQLHYANAGVTEAFVCPVQEEGGVRTARIPDEVLQASGTLWVYAYVEAEEGYTKQVASFYVKARPQPADYVYTPTQWVKLEDVMARMDVLENKAETDPTVPGWAKQPQKPAYNAQEVGARANTWLPSLTEIGAAPAGFGLGEHIYHHSADGVLEFFDEQLATMPNGTKKFIEFAGDYQTTQGALFVGELCKRDNNYAYVIGYTYSDAMGLYRAKYNGVWNPWEYINPPMVAGEEYRTTERYNGKPVYAKLVSYYAPDTIGNTTAITDIEIPHQISNYGALVRCEAKVSSSPLPVFYSGTAITCVKQVDLANVVLRIINDVWHNGTFEFCIYYTKE